MLTDELGAKDALQHGSAGKISAANGKFPCGGAAEAYRSRVAGDGLERGVGGRARRVIEWPGVLRWRLTLARPMQR
jgi:hypothetical protein